jgi:DNA polymerase III subunit gamma/tau
MRMLAFQPAPAAGDAPKRVAPSRTSSSAPAASSSATTGSDRAPVAAATTSVTARQMPEPEPRRATSSAQAQAAPASAPDAAPSPGLRFTVETWMDFVDQADLRGPAREFATHLGFLADDGDSVRVSLPASHEHLRNDVALRKLQDAMAVAAGRGARIMVELQAVVGDTAAARAAREKSGREAVADAAINDDPFVQRAIAEFGARIIPDTIKPID